GASTAEQEHINEVIARTPSTVQHTQQVGETTVKIHVLKKTDETSGMGIPRKDGATSITEMVNAHAGVVDGEVHIYVTEGYFDELTSNENMLDELIDHEYKENIEAAEPERNIPPQLRHRYAAQGSRNFINEGEHISAFHKWYLDQLAQEGTPQALRILESFSREDRTVPAQLRGDARAILEYEAEFLKYAQGKIGVQPPAMPADFRISRRDFIREAVAAAAGVAIAPSVTVRALGAEAPPSAKDELERLGQLGLVNDPMGMLLARQSRAISYKRELDGWFQRRMNLLLPQYYEARNSGDEKTAHVLWQDIAGTTRSYLKRVEEFESKNSAFMKAHLPRVRDLFIRTSGRFGDTSSLLIGFERETRHAYDRAKHERELNEKLLSQGLLFLPEGGRNIHSAQEAFISQPGRPTLTKQEREKLIRETFVPARNALLDYKISVLDSEIAHFESKKKSEEEVIGRFANQTHSMITPIRQRIADYETRIALLEAQRDALKGLRKLNNATTDKERLDAQQDINKAVIAEQRLNIIIIKKEEEELRTYHGPARVEPAKDKEGRLDEFQRIRFARRHSELIEKIMVEISELGGTLAPSLPERNEELDIDHEYGARLLIFHARSNIYRAVQAAGQQAARVDEARGEYQRSLAAVNKAWGGLDYIEFQRDISRLQYGLAQLEIGQAQVMQAYGKSQATGYRSLMGGSNYKLAHQADRARIGHLMQQARMNRAELQAWMHVSRTKRQAREAAEGIEYFKKQAARAQAAIPQTRGTYNGMIARWVVNSHRIIETPYFDVENLIPLQSGRIEYMSPGEVPARLDALADHEEELLELESERITTEMNQTEKDLMYKPAALVPLLKQYIVLMNGARRLIDYRLEAIRATTDQEAEAANDKYKQAQANQAALELQFAKAMSDHLSTLARGAETPIAGRYLVTGTRTRAEYCKALQGFWARRTKQAEQGVEKGLPSSVSSGKGQPAIERALELGKPAVGDAKVKVKDGKDKTMPIMLPSQLRRAANGRYVKGAVRPSGDVVQDPQTKTWHLRERLVQRKGKLDGEEEVNYDEVVGSEGAVAYNGADIVTVAYEEGRTVVNEQPRELGVDPENEARIADQYPDPEERAKHRKYLVAHHLYVGKDVKVSGRTQRMLVPVGVGIRSLSRTERNTKLTAADVIAGRVEFENVIDVTEEDTYEASTKTQETTTEEVRFYLVPSIERLGKPAVIETEKKPKGQAAADRKGETVVAAAAMSAAGMGETIDARIDKLDSNVEFFGSSKRSHHVNFHMIATATALIRDINATFQAGAIDPGAYEAYLGRLRVIGRRDAEFSSQGIINSCIEVKTFDEREAEMVAFLSSDRISDEIRNYIAMARRDDLPTAGDVASVIPTLSRSISAHPEFNVFIDKTSPGFVANFVVSALMEARVLAEKGQFGLVVCIGKVVEGWIADFSRTAEKMTEEETRGRALRDALEQNRHIFESFTQEPDFTKYPHTYKDVYRLDSNELTRLVLTYLGEEAANLDPNNPIGEVIFAGGNDRSTYFVTFNTRDGRSIETVFYGSWPEQRRATSELLMACGIYNTYNIFTLGGVRGAMAPRIAGERLSANELPEDQKISYANQNEVARNFIRNMARLARGREVVFTRVHPPDMLVNRDTGDVTIIDHAHSLCDVDDFEDYPQQVIAEIPPDVPDVLQDQFIDVGELTYLRNYIDGWENPEVRREIIAIFNEEFINADTILKQNIGLLRGRAENSIRQSGVSADEAIARHVTRFESGVSADPHILLISIYDLLERGGLEGLYPSFYRSSGRTREQIASDGEFWAGAKAEIQQQTPQAKPLVGELKPPISATDVIRELPIVELAGRMELSSSFKITQVIPKTRKTSLVIGIPQEKATAGMIQAVQEKLGGMGRRDILVVSVERDMMEKKLSDLGVPYGVILDVDKIEDIDGLLEPFMTELDLQSLFADYPILTDLTRLESVRLDRNTLIKIARDRRLIPLITSLNLEYMFSRTKDTPAGKYPVRKKSTQTRTAFGDTDRFMDKEEFKTSPIHFARIREDFLKYFKKPFRRVFKKWAS
ncbi:MAG: hypothetical protein HQ547_03045, partial [Candidatus Omnitrophica bacterium]|nr:hypothetical protein [Candidatus Omnitrophota bacterium]